MTTFLRCAARLGLAAALLAGCARKMERPGGPGSKPQPDPRATGQSTFENELPAGSGGPPPRMPPLPTVDTELPGPIEIGETAVVSGSLLYALDHGGLQLIDVGGTVAVRGRVRLPGTPHALFVAGGTAYAIMSASIRLPACPACPDGVRGLGSSVVAAVDVTNPGAPAVRSSLRLPGQVTAAALDSSGLHVVLRQGDGGVPPAGGPGASLVSIDVTNPAALTERGRLDVPAPNWIEEARFAPGVVYLGVYGRQFWAGNGCQPLGDDPAPAGADGCTRMLAVDLQTMRARASLDVRGYIAPGASDYQPDVLRALVHSSGAAIQDARVVTLRSRSAAELTALGTLDLGGTTRPDSFRFAGDRLYVESYDRENAVLVIDLAQPARPVVAGRVAAGAKVVSDSAGRLVIAGSEGLRPQCEKGAVTMLDVSNPAAPRLLAHETVGSIGRAGSGFAAGADLVVLPFSTGFTVGPLPEPYAPAGIQLFDVDLARASVRARGKTLVGADVERVERIGDRIVALSSQRAEVVDVRDRDNPAMAGSVHLHRWVSDLRPAGGAVVQLVSDWTFRAGYGPYDDRFHFYVMTPTELDPPSAAPALTLSGRPGPLFSEGHFVYAFRKAKSTPEFEPRLEVLELSGRALRQRGSLSLAGPAAVTFDSEPAADDRFSRDVRQVAGTTFLVPLWRVSDCRPPIPGTTVTVPTTCESGAAPAPPPPVAPPPPPASTAALQTQVPADCPGSDQDFLVVDASEPDRPRVASRFRLEGGRSIDGTITQGRTVLVTQQESTRRPDGRTVVRSFATEVDLADADHPALSAPINVPGPVVAARPAERTWYTVAPIPVPDGQPAAGLLLSALYHPAGSDKVFLQQQLRLDGAVSGPLADGDHLFFTADGQILTVDLRPLTGPAITARTPVPGANDTPARWEAVFPWSRPLPPRTSAPSIYADVRDLIAGHLFVTLNGTVLIYDVRDPTHPRLTPRVLLPASPPRQISRDLLMVPGYDWAVDTIDLNAP